MLSTYCAEKETTFIAGSMPAKLPDLSNHTSFFADTMRAQPDLFEKLKSKTTKLGVNIGHCIKTGVDNKGHPMIKTVGAVAGDEESYELFKEFFDPVISARHNGYAADAKHPTDMNPANLSTTPIDPTGKYVLTTRCRTGRSVRGTRLPPCCSFEERRELERVIVKALLNLEGDLKGDYFPLHGSRSYAAKPTGMTEEKEESLRKNENFFVWVNEEDQMRIVSMQKGASVVEIFKRFAAATEGIQKVLKEEGYDFMHNDHLGWVLTCPSNLGT